MHSYGGIPVRLGIMQPYFFPYLGYFDLINRTDRWIVFDTAQYIRHGWVNRNRILHSDSEWQYILVPLKKHSRKAAIKDIAVTIKILFQFCGVHYFSLIKLVGNTGRQVYPCHPKARNLIETVL